MAAYTFRAVDTGGRQHSGVVEAGSEAGARQTLRERQLLPLFVEPTSARSSGGAAGARRSLALTRAISGRMLALFTRQLATLLEGGVRVEEALRTVASQCNRPRAASVLLNIRAAILEGQSFARALDAYPETFSDIFRASVAAGEESNRLGAVLAHLAEHVETYQRNRQKVQLALLYPALLATVSLMVLVLLVTYVVPDIARAFSSRGEALPLLTRLMIGLSELIASYGLVLLLGVAAAILGLRTWLGSAVNRQRLHRLVARSRLTASASRRLNAAQFASTMATLLQSGVPLPDALDASVRTASNLYIREKIREVSARVREGASLHRAVTEADCFPPMLTAMIASGQDAASLGPALARAAADQQREIDIWVATIVSLVEPGVLLLMGGLVLLMVLSILLPIVGLNDLAGAGL